MAGVKKRKRFKNTILQYDLSSFNNERFQYLVNLSPFEWQKRVLGLNLRTGNTHFSMFLIKLLANLIKL